MKRVCWALVGGGIAWAIILLMVYWCTEWRASPCVVTPRAATAEATADGHLGCRAGSDHPSSLLSNGYDSRCWPGREDGDRLRRGDQIDPVGHYLPGRDAMRRALRC